MSEATIIGPFSPNPKSDTRILKLVQGDQVLGELVYYDSVGTVVEVDPYEGPIHDLLVREARSRGLLHGHDIPDHLQHDQEQR